MTLHKLQLVTILVVKCPYYCHAPFFIVGPPPYGQPSPSTLHHVWHSPDSSPQNWHRKKQTSSQSYEQRHMIQTTPTQRVDHTHNSCSLLPGHLNWQYAEKTNSTSSHFLTISLNYNPPIKFFVRV